MCVKPAPYILTPVQRCPAACWNRRWCVWEPPKAECLERPREEGDRRKAVQWGSRDDHEHREHFTEAAGRSAGDAQAKVPEVVHVKREQACRSVMGDHKGAALSKHLEQKKIKPILHHLCIFSPFYLHTLHQELFMHEMQVPLNCSGVAAVSDSSSIAQLWNYCFILGPSVHTAHFPLCSAGN